MSPPPAAGCRHENFIAGSWRPPAGGAYFPDENPARRGSSLGEFPLSQPADVTAAVDAAATAFPIWRRTTLAVRQRCVAQFLDALAARREELAQVVCRENGKTIREARAEVDSALVEGRHHLHQIAVFAGGTIPVGSAPATGWLRYEPVGVAAIISPWNFPLNVFCRKAVPALLTGCTVVFKPASFTPWTAIELARLLAATDLPPGVFNVVCGAGSALGNALIDDVRVRALSFTGSTPVGIAIQRRAAGRLLRTQLELGGKNALIIADDADLDAAVGAAVTAGFACAGQWCTSTSRILVFDAVHDAVCDLLARRCAALRLGDPLDADTDMGPVAGPEQFAGVTAAIARARAQGGREIAGGVADPAGYFVRPTVFDGVGPDMDLFREEVFGPVLALTRVRDLDHALALANDSDFGLSSALFTRDLGRATRYIDGIEAGMAHVNIHSGYKHPALPFGGWKASGFGPAENGISGLEFFVDSKSVYLGS